MRDPEQIAADLENMAEQYARPSYPFLADADALLREAAEALRESQALAVRYEQEADHFCRLHGEAKNERDALIAYAKTAEDFFHHQGMKQTRRFIDAREALPEPLRQRIEAE